MDGSSNNALDVSARGTEDLKYIQALTVNVSNFVSVKLSGRGNYKIWKAQMLCIIESQVLLHIINDQHPFPVDKGGVHMISQYDKLVKGWIFCSVNEKMLEDLVDLGTAHDVWVKLESLFNSPISDTEGVPSTRTEELRYMLASTVNISDFVSVKLLGRRNYDVWKTQMLCLIESYDLLHTIHAKARFPWDKGDPMTQVYDKLVRGWILSTLTSYVHRNFQFYQSVQLLWRNLELKFTGGSSHETDDLKYMQASTLNVSNFVSVKLSGPSNYHTWKAQMLRLIESQDLLHLICDKFRDSRYACNDVVKGWIFGTMKEELIKDFSDNNLAEELWVELESRFTDGTYPINYHPGMYLISEG
ncbi:hypothetical protein Hanom_Chr03g00230091 [Helianthus anomalus]